MIIIQSLVNKIGVENKSKGIFYMSYLYRFEIKGIQNFVFATNKMKEISGGSALIDSLFVPKEWDIREEEILAEAAGAATLQFSSKEDLQKFAQNFPMYVQYRATITSITFCTSS